VKYKVVLKEKKKLSSNISQFIFSIEENYTFYSGQWLDFYLNIDNKEYIGGYSIVSTPFDKGIVELAIKYSEKNIVTRYLHESSKNGEIFYISEAKGNIYFEPSINKNIVLIAGGIGITPLISIFKYANKINYPYSLKILYSVKNIENLVYKDEIENVVNVNSLFKAYYFITNKASYEFTGRIDKNILKKCFNNNTVFFLCGPFSMIDDINNILLKIGVNKDHILYEKWW
jgi:ferredoxin-NADP reductase